LPTALEDLDRGRRFYARQGSSVGAYFLDALFSDIDSLELYAGVHMKVFDFHRLLAKRFPYAVYYKVDGETCIVFRVLDCRQEPDKTTEALR
jgi:plasmid stabilization system protein ParE